MLNDGTTTNITLAVKDRGTDTSILKQYGMRYPDGTVRWGEDKIHPQDYSMGFDSIAKNAEVLEHWHDRLRKRAAAAQIDPEDYVDSHIPLTRTVIVVITEAEVS